MVEIWKDVDGFVGLYQVSNLGRIKALGRYVKTGNGGKRYIEEHFVKPNKCKNGYLEATFSRKQKRTVRLLHRVVAKAFIPNPDNLPEVNHKDEDIQNCQVENLEWCTSKYNANYGSRNVRMIEKRGNTKPVIQKTKDGDFIRRFDSVAEATRATGAFDSAIIKVCNGKQKTSVGYRWEYAD